MLGTIVRAVTAYGTVSIRVSHCNSRFQEVEGIIQRGTHKGQYAHGTLAPAKPARQTQRYRAALPRDTVTKPDSHRFNTGKLDKCRNFPGERPTHLISN